MSTIALCLLAFATYQGMLQRSIMCILLPCYLLHKSIVAMSLEYLTPTSLDTNTEGESTQQQPPVLAKSKEREALKMLINYMMLLLLSNLLGLIVPFTALYKLLQTVLLTAVVFSDYKEQCYSLIKQYYPMIENHVDRMISYTISMSKSLYDQYKVQINTIVDYLKNVIKAKQV